MGSEESWQCKNCLTSFKSLPELVSHDPSNCKKKTGINYTCKFCEKKFYSKLSLKSHEKVHKNALKLEKSLKNIKL